MKVLMTADAVGGVWTYALELAAGLSAHDVSVVLATMGPAPSTAQKKAALAIPGLELASSRYKLEWMDEPWTDVDCAGEWLLDIAARKSVDLVHLNGYAHGALRWPCPVLIVGHSCVFSWWQAVHGAPPPSEWATYRERVVAGLSRADCIVAPTHAFLDCLKRWYAPATECRVIRNARSAQLFEPAEQIERLPVALACGRMWDEAKGLGTLDRIAADLPWHVYVAGDLTSPDGSARHASSLFCLGALPATDLALWMKRASIFVHPSRYEPFGLAPLEAAIAGCALVLSDLPSLRELWADAAVFVDAEDADALRATLLSLMGEPDRCHALREAARERARRFEPRAMSNAYMGIYRELLIKHGARERAVA